MNETKYLPAIQEIKYGLPASSERMENEEWRMKILNTGKKIVGGKKMRTVIRLYADTDIVKLEVKTQMSKVKATGQRSKLGVGGFKNFEF